MEIRMTIDVAEALSDELHESAAGDYVKTPLVTGSGKLGPAFPEDENPHDLVFS
jgi:hypothetical protein